MSSTIDNINWYPGHMKKTRELIRDNLKMVDMVIEVIDSRIPVSSRNPVIDELIQNKSRIIVLNKMDLGDPIDNKKWVDFLSEDNTKVLEMNCMKGDGLKSLLKLLEVYQKRQKEAGKIKPFRLMIVGVPNCGKSSLINRLTGKKSAKTGDRPGVTKGKQWINMANGMQILDTPGILWPKFEDPQVGKNLAYCGSIKEEILDIEELALSFILELMTQYPKLLIERYKLEELGETPLATMEDIAKKRGFILPGKRIDYKRTAVTLMDEFQNGKIGRITLEKIQKPLGA